MNIEIIETRDFIKILNLLLKRRKLLDEDYIDFKKKLVGCPDSGDTISGTGGIRKIRLKSPSGGKSGGFRICYYYILNRDKIYLLYIYPKNEQEDLSIEDKKILKQAVTILKEVNK